MSAKSPLRRMLSLSADDLALSLLALPLLCASHLVIRTVPFRLWRSWVDRVCGEPPGSFRVGTGARIRPQQVSHAVARAVRLVPRSRCLVQALCGAALFRLYGFRPQFAIGVRLEARRRMLAHAWVVVDGTVRIGWLPDLPLYRQLALEQRLPAGSAVGAAEARR